MDGEGTMVPCVIVDGERSCVYVLPLYRVSYPLESQDNLPSNLNRLGIETVRSREASCLEKRSFFQRANITRIMNIDHLLELLASCKAYKRYLENLKTIR